MRVYVCSAVAAIVLILLAPAVADAVEYTVADLGYMGGVYMYYGDGPRCMNNAGDMIGYTEVGTYPSRTYEHLLIHYHTGATLDIDASTHDDFIGNSINDHGQVVGYSFTTQHAFMYDGAAMHDLGTLGGKSSEAYAINGRGDVAGESEIGNTWHAFLYYDSKMHDLDVPGRAYAVNDARQVVGSSWNQTFNAYHAFLYSNGAIQDLGVLDGDTASVALAINASGEVVGDSENPYKPSDPSAAFRYINGHMEDLGNFGGTQSVALAINASGDIVGNSSLSGDLEYHAFVYHDNHMIDLNNVLSSDCGFVLEYATSINDLGQIVGTGTDADGNMHAFLLTPVPEPGSLSLLALAGLSALRRRRTAR